MACAVAFAALVGIAQESHAAEALVLLNANVYTAWDRQPRAEALIAKEGRITYVGTSAAARRLAPKGAKVIDLRGRTVLPGLTDAHAHLAGIGSRELSFNLEGTTGIDDLQNRLRSRVADTLRSAGAAAASGLDGAALPGDGDSRPRRDSAPRSDWIVGRGWIESRWIPAVFPTNANLDAVVSDRPVLLTRADGHAAVANSLALQLARVDSRTPDPTGGQILKDPKTGEPTGMLIDNAVDLVGRLIPDSTEADHLRALEVGASRSVRLGWTQLHNAGSSFDEIDRLCTLYRSGKIKLRIYNAINGPGPDADRLLQQGPATTYCGDRLTVRSIKLYIDGALGSRGAALLAPYTDAPDSQGLLVNRPDDLKPLLATALQRGIQIETHAIGDRGNRIVLDLYEEALAAVSRKSRVVPVPRWRIEHAQILDPADIPRFAKLGVIASMQPSHAISDLYFAPKRLGPERLRGAYAWRSLLKANAMIVAGSDAPVEQGNPMVEFYAAVARRGADGFANDDWHLEQRVTRDEALKMLTLWPAYAAFQEKERGSLEVGKLADITVLSADIMKISEPEILRTRAVMTIIGGEIVYEEPAWLRRAYPVFGSRPTDPYTRTMHERRVVSAS
ncbi:MAG: amidohydrolase [Gammaproteobacteria bacterium]